jgi:Family of unknown function (DUF6586)
MAHLPAVNEKRIYAQLLCQQAINADDRHLKRALLQGAVLHLHRAFIFYLAEVAETYQCPSAEAILTPSGLLSKLAESGKSPAEAQELEALAGTTGSWLFLLLASTDQIAQPTQPTKQLVQDDLIATRNQRDDIAVELSEERVEHWIEAFNTMIERHRQTMVEF